MHNLTTHTRTAEAELSFHNKYTLTQDYTHTFYFEVSEKAHSVNDVLFQKKGEVNRY